MFTWKIEVSISGFRILKQTLHFTYSYICFESRFLLRNVIAKPACPLQIANIWKETERVADCLDWTLYSCRRAN